MTVDGPDTVGKDFFADRTVALFAVPGAFTPTCSARHLPGLIDQGEALKAKGVDAIACTALNDIFVLGAWAKANHAEGITMLADGRGTFAEAIGLSMDSEHFGMGCAASAMRCWSRTAWSRSSTSRSRAASAPPRRSICSPSSDNSDKSSLLPIPIRLAFLQINVSLSIVVGTKF
jgi:hypothetical protein